MHFNGIDCSREYTLVGALCYTNIYQLQDDMSHNQMIRSIVTVIINKKLQKIKTKTLYARKKENEEMKKSKTEISTWMQYLLHVIT